MGEISQKKTVFFLAASLRWSDTFKKLFENGSILFTEKPRREKRILDTLDLPVSDHETAARCYD